MSSRASMVVSKSLSKFCNSVPNGNLKTADQGNKLVWWHNLLKEMK